MSTYAHQRQMSGSGADLIFDGSALAYPQLNGAFAFDALAQPLQTGTDMYGQTLRDVAAAGNSSGNSSGDDDHTQHPTGEGAERAHKRTATGVNGSPGASANTAASSEKKKPGRKPIVDQPTSKRKAQNRAAQRAFRERKENHVKQLEDRVAELEKQASSQQQENQFLKEQLQRFRQSAPRRTSDSQPLKQDFEPVQSRAFTFNLEGAYPSPEASSASPKSAMRRASTNSQALESPLHCPSLSPGTSSTGTSPATASEKDFFNPAALPHFGRDPSDVALEGSVLSGMMHATPASFADLTTTSTTIDFFGQQPKLAQDEPLLFSSDNKGFPAPSMMTYRGADDGLDMLDLFDDQLLFGATGEPSTSELFGGLTDTPLSEPPTVAKAENISMLTCPEAWSKIVSHPKFETFDLDQLCADMRSKAVCSQNTGYIKSEDVDDSMDVHTKRMLALDKALDAHANRHQTSLN